MECMMYEYLYENNIGNLLDYVLNKICIVLNFVIALSGDRDLVNYFGNKPGIIDISSTRG